MKHVLIVDTNKSFLSDIEARCFLDDINSVDMADSLDEAYKKSDEVRYDEVVVAGNLLNEIGDYQNKPFTARCVTYARNADEILDAEDKGYRSYGIVKNSGALLSAIDEGRVVSVKNDEQPKAAPKRNTRYYDDEDEYFDEEEDFDDDRFESESLRSEKRQREASNERAVSRRENDREDRRYRDDRVEYDDYEDRGRRDRYEDERPRRRDYDNEQRRDDRERRPRRDEYDEERYRRDDYDDRRPSRRDYDDDYDYDERPRRRDYDDTPPERSRDTYDERRQEPRRESPPSSRSDIRSAVSAKRTNDKRSRDESEYEVERDMGNITEPAHVITVYSAKGGVGKTTLSCELATFLALSAHGRDRFKVCLVDFNVDFGDVLNTLALSPKQRGMSNWSEQIKERLRDRYGEGEYTDDEIDSIDFTKPEIDDYLQTVPESDLKVLIAPISNEDSMELMLGGEDIRIMLRNLRDNGEFDFVICDTGNNTRNSAFIPLEMSDDILMIVTQSVNTANCNSSFLSTLNTIGFDTNPVKVVVNRARSKKLTGISVDELLEVMCDPRTKRQLECAGVIREVPEVEVAENRGIPLVYDPSSAFTKSIAQIAKAVNKESFSLKKPEKKKLFGRRKNK